MRQIVSSHFVQTEGRQKCLIKRWKWSQSALITFASLQVKIFIQAFYDHHARPAVEVDTMEKRNVYAKSQNKVAMIELER